MDTDTTYTPEGPGGPRRGLFTRRPDAPDVPSALRRGRRRARRRDRRSGCDEGLRAIEEHAADPDARDRHRDVARLGRGHPSRAGPHPELHLAGPGDPEPRSRRATSGSRRSRFARRVSRTRSRSWPRTAALVREAIQLVGELGPRDRELPDPAGRRDRSAPSSSRSRRTSPRRSRTSTNATRTSPGRSSSGSWSTATSSRARPRGSSRRWRATCRAAPRPWAGWPQRIEQHADRLRHPRRRRSPTRFARRSRTRPARARSRSQMLGERVGIQGADEPGASDRDGAPGRDARSWGWRS